MGKMSMMAWGLSKKSRTEKLLRRYEGTSKEKQERIDKLITATADKLFDKVEEILNEK